MSHKPTLESLVLLFTFSAVTACNPGVEEGGTLAAEATGTVSSSGMTVLDLMDAVQVANQQEHPNECTEGACCEDGRFLPADHACRVADSTQSCDVTEYCTGISSECPEDGYASPTQECRPAYPGDKCDVPEFCSGDSPACPPDSFAPPTQVCRPMLVGTGCDEAEYCSGSSPSCPPDTFASVLQECRPKDDANSCDVAEFCSGDSLFCPDDTPSTVGVGACQPGPFDLGLHDVGIADYTSLMFGADVAALDFVTSPRLAGSGAARLMSGRNGITQGWGIGGRFTFPEAKNMDNFTRISYEIQSNQASPNIRVALEILIDAGGENESVWRQRSSTQLRLSDVAGQFETVVLNLNPDDFERSDGGPTTTMDTRRVSAVQFLMLIEPNTSGARQQTMLYIDEIRFQDRWMLSEYETHRPPTSVANASPATVDQFDVGGTERLAVLVTDSADQWLGVAHGMKVLGVPFRMTTDPAEALKHKVVVVFPSIPNDASLVAALRKHVQEGGTLMAQVMNTALNDVFGLQSVEFVPGSQRFHQGQEITSVHFTHDHPALTASLNHAREQRVPIHRRELGINLPTWRYGGTAHPAVAVYDGATGERPSKAHDNVAISYNRFGTGKAYALGLNLGRYALQNFNGFGGGLGRDYINAFEPGVDVLFRLIRDIYVEDQGTTVGLATLPNDESLAVMLTHDIDTAESVNNALEYAKLEQSEGVPGTYFIQTKYVSDAQESAFRGVGAMQALAKVQTMGMEVASHSVAHARNFNTFSLGLGTEQFQSYRPVNVEGASELEAIGGTILGDLRVSRFLLEDFVHDVRVVSFRPGHLRHPKALSQAMEAVGYRYGSIAPAADNLTHLPHRMTHGRGFDAETGVFDFPVTIEDEREDSPIVTGRMEDALNIAEHISGRGGIFVMLVHPNFLGEKLGFIEDFIKATKDKYMFTTVGEFGRWWARRDQVQIHTQEIKDLLRVTIDIPQPISGLTLELPPNRTLSQMGNGIEAVEIPEKSRLVITSEVSGRLELYLRKK